MIAIKDSLVGSGSKKLQQQGEKILIVGGLFDYSATPGPFLREFETKLLEISQSQGEKSLMVGGLFDYSVTPGPFL